MVEIKEAARIIEVKVPFGSLPDKIQQLVYEGRTAGYRMHGFPIPVEAH